MPFPVPSGKAWPVAGQDLNKALYFQRESCHAPLSPRTAWPIAFTAKPDESRASLPPPPPFPPLRIRSGQGVTVKGRPRGEFRLAQALTSAMKTLSANTEARLSVDCIDGDKDVA